MSSTGPIYGPPYPYTRNDNEYLALQSRNAFVRFRLERYAETPLPNPREGTYRIQRGPVWVDRDLATGAVVARSEP
jgi:hypothetical protein